MKNIQHTSHWKFILTIGIILSLLLAFSGPTVVVVHAQDGNPPSDSDDDKGGDNLNDHPTTPGGSVSSIFISTMNTILHKLIFDSTTISEALGKIFLKAATENEEAIQAEQGVWTGMLAQVINAPSGIDYASIASQSKGLAGGLAVGLFVLRLAMYHWRRMTGESDTPLNVLGDWFTAGVLAVVAGPFLDIVVDVGWFSVGKMIGSPAAMSAKFVSAMVSRGFLDMYTTGTFITFIRGALSIILWIAALLAVAGMIIAFAVAVATLHVLAILGPICAIAGVLQEMRWLRSLWIKGVVMVSLMPIMAGGIFNAGISMAGAMSKPGLMTAIIRLIWLFGSAGMLLSLAGIMGRITLGAAADALGKMWNAAGSIALVAGAAIATGGASLAASGAAAGAGAAGASASGAGAAGSAGLGAGAMGAGNSAAGAGSSGGLGGAGGLGGMESLNKAQLLNNLSTMSNAIGLPGAARTLGGMARGHEIEARKSELAGRVENFGGQQSAPQTTQRAPDIGISGVAPQSVNAMLQNFGGSADEFKQVFPNILNGASPADKQQISGMINADPGKFGSMVGLYKNNSDYYNSTNDLFGTLAKDAGF